MADDLDLGRGQNLAEYYGIHDELQYNNTEEGIAGSKVNRPLRVKEFGS